MRVRNATGQYVLRNLSRPGCYREAVTVHEMWGACWLWHAYPETGFAGSFKEAKRAAEAAVARRTP